MPLDLDRVLLRRAKNALLDRSGADPRHIARSLVALHGTDPVVPYLSVAARMPHRPIHEIIAQVKGEVESGGLVRFMAMRRTVHVVDRDHASLCIAHAADRLGKPQKKLAVEMIALSGVSQTYEQLADGVMAALDGVSLTPDALCERVPELGTRVRLSVGKAYEGEAPISRYVLEAMGVDGRIVRAGQVGKSWRQNLNTWTRTDRHVPGVRAVTPADAYRELIRAHLAAFAPVTVADLEWWMGIPKRAVQAALEGLPTAEIDGALMLRDQLDGFREGADPHPPAFLPALDPSVMALKERDLYLDPAWTARLFDRTGNAGPTIWLGGRVIGGWACRKDGTIAIEVLDPRVDRAQIEVAAREFEAAMGGEVVAPRFPSPQSKELGGR